MGRELKRVPLDFDWPMNKPWAGFVNPYYAAIKCESCDGSGYSPAAKRIADRWYGDAPFHPIETGSNPFTYEHPAVREFAERNVRNSPEYYGTDKDAITREAVRLAAMWDRQWCHHLSDDDVAALVAEGRLVDFTHTWTKEKGWKPKDPPYMPTAQEVNVWSLQPMGHDSINRWICVRAACKRQGIEVSCSHCDGEGEAWPSKEHKRLYETWERLELPEGDGYQIWETVSEGSPISPVFATPEELASYMAAHPWGGDDGTSAETWLKFIMGPGWSVSMVMDDNRLKNGVTAAVEAAPENV